MLWMLLHLYPNEVKRELSSDEILGALDRIQKQCDSDHSGIVLLFTCSHSYFCTRNYDVIHRHKTQISVQQHRRRAQWKCI